MKYSSSLPQKNDNISHNNPFGEFILLCGGIAALFLIIFWLLGLFVDVAAERISYETETALYKSISKHFDFQYDTISEEQKQIQSFVEKLQSCSQLPYDLQVYMVQSDTPNAFALPGGKISVTTGLLKEVTTENGLAFVLAHELAHFKNRDHLRSMGRSLIVYLLFSMFTGADSTISSFLVPTSSFSQAQYSQVRETLADHAALDTLHCYYGHVGGAFDFFTKLLDSEQGSAIKVFHYFSSHPQLQERISDLSQYADEQGYTTPPDILIPR